MEVYHPLKGIKNFTQWKPIVAHIKCLHNAHVVSSKCSDDVAVLQVFSMSTNMHVRVT